MEMMFMKNILVRYKGISSQSINFNKSSVTFSPSTSMSDRKKVCERLKVGELRVPG